MIFVPNWNMAQTMSVPPQEWIMMATIIWRSALFVLLTAGMTTIMALPYLS
jgi:hypothetical protein